MSHFAQLDENNVVINVIVVADEDCQDSDGNESEAVGVAFCQSLLGSDTNWKQTSYNANIRKNFAGIGCTYDESRDAFIPYCPYDSWTLNETTCDWEAPTPAPTTEGKWIWDEDSLSWVNQDV